MVIALDSLSVKNFRGIKEAKVSRFTDVNLFLGKNGSGKSTLLEAIYLASTFASLKDSLEKHNKADVIAYRRCGRGDWLAFRDLFWFRMDVSKPIEIELTFTNGNKRKRTLSFKVFNKDSGGRAWLDLSILKDAVSNLSNISIREHELVNYAEKHSYDKAMNIIKPLPYAIAETIAKVFENELNFLRNTVLVDDRILRNPKLVETAVWPKLLAKRLDKEVIELIKTGYESDAEGLTYMPLGKEFCLAIQLSKTTVRVDDLGDGARVAVLLGAILAVTQNAFVLVEDLESHQHPGGLDKLLRFVFELAKKNSLQLFMTTHSIELVQIAEKITTELGLGLRTFFIERDEEGVVDTRALEAVDLDVLQKLGLDPRFLHII